MTMDARENSQLKLKLCTWSNIVEYSESNGNVHFICFRQEISFLAKFDPNNQNCQFKLKFGA